MKGGDHDQLLELARRELLRSGAFIGAGAGFGVGATAPVAAAETDSEPEVEYTLTVLDEDGNEIGSTTATEAVGLEDFGNRIRVGNLGNSSWDGDHGIIDNIRYGDGEVIENWDERTLANYSRTSWGGGSFRMVSSPTSNGSRALELETGQSNHHYTSDEDLVTIKDGTVIEGDIRHETDNSRTFAMRTEFGVGMKEDGSSGIRLALINPGSQRTAGAYVRTSDVREYIAFTPNLSEFYTFRLEVSAKGVIDRPQFDYTPIASDEGEEITFDASDTAGDVEEYTWEFGDDTTETGEVVTHTYEEPGQYDVTLTVQGSSGSVETTETVGVGSLEVEQTRERTTINSPVTAQVMEPTGDGYEYHWRVLDKPEDSEPHVLHGENYPEGDQPPNPEAKPHAALRPDVAGEDPYVLEVEAFDDDGDYLGIEVVEIEVEERELDEIVGFDVDGAETVSELVELYAPNYHFHSREKYIPTRYEAYAENASVLELLIEDDTNRTLWELLLDGAGSVGDLLDIWRSDTVLAWIDATFGYDFLAGTPSLLDLGEIADEEPDGPLALHLHGDETDYREYQVQYPPTIHANVHATLFAPESGMGGDVDEQEYLAVTYWAFYLFDPKKEGDGWSDFDDSVKAFATSHASDTETVTILIDEDGPQWVAAAQHYSGEYMQWEKVSGTDGPTSIDIYPSWGAHSSFLVNTKKYDSKIPGQERWIGPEKDSTFPLGGLASDVTASYWEWSYDDSQYDLIVLTGDEPWGDFEGEFTSGNGLPEAEGGVLPHKRDERFDDAGEWIPGRMLPEPDVLDPDHPELEIPKIFSRFTIDSVVGSPSSFKIEPFENPGVKPHTFVTEATVTATATGETWNKKERTELGWTGMTPVGATTIEISLDDLDLPDEGDLVVEAEILTYSSDIASETDVIYETTEDTSLSLLPVDLSVPDFMTAESDQGTVAPDDVIERSVEIKNEGSETDSVLVTLTAVDPYRRFHIDDFDGHETITIDPDESREMTLSWTADEDIPEGEYDLRMQVWAESDLEERVTELAEYTEQNAFSVEKPDGTLSVSTTPPDAAVVVNGELLDEQSVEHPVGTHKVTAIHGEFGTETKSVRIEEGKTTRIEIDLVGDEPWVGDYTNARWIVTKGGLKRAERDWSRGEIHEDLYRKVKRAYEHGEPLYDHRTPGDDQSNGRSRGRD